MDCRCGLAVLALLLLVSVVHGNTVTKTTTILPAEEATQDCGVACDPVGPVVTFTAAEFGCPSQVVITDIGVSVTAFRTAGTCTAAPVAGPWDTVSYSLDLMNSLGDPLGSSQLFANSFTSTTADQFTLGFDEASPTNAFGSVASTIYKPAGGFGDLLNEPATEFQFQLLAGETSTAADGQLCTQKHSIVVTAACLVSDNTNAIVFESADGCGTFCSPITDTITYTAADFSCPAGGGFVISEVQPNINFVKAANTCQTPGSGNPGDSEISYSMNIVGGPSTVLVAPGAYSDSANPATVSATFRDDAANPLTTPMTGFVQPSGSLSVFKNLAADSFTFQLVAGDTLAPRPLCTLNWSVRLFGYCIPEAPVTMTTCVAMSESTDGVPADPLASSAITFAPTDFGCPNAMNIRDVVATVDFLKTSGTCAAPTGDPPQNDDLRYILTGQGQIEHLINFGDYTVDAPLPGPVSVVFGTPGADMPVSGMPTSGNFLPDITVFDNLGIEAGSSIDFSLLAGDSIPGNPLCTLGFCAEVQAVCAGPVTLTCANVMANNDAGMCSAAVALSVTATGQTLVIQTGGVDSGGDFPVGTNSVKFEASGVGGLASCSFDVIVADTEDPVITCPADVVVDNDSGACNAVVNYALPTATDNCGATTITRVSGPPSGATVAVGDRTVTYRATDGAGNTDDCSFMITVNDIQDPILENCPMDITAMASGPGCSAVVSYVPPTASDNCNVNAVRIQGPAPGSTFPVGTSLIRYEAVDDSGNTSAECSFTITVTDAANPTINNCPSDITVDSEAGECSAAVSFTAPTASDNCAGSTIMRTAGLDPGSDFPVGTTTVTYVASDSEGNMSAPCSFDVTVQDNENPSIVNCPSDITADNDAGLCGASVTYVAPTAADNCPGATADLTGGSLPSGSFFSLGDTTVTYEATDASGNVSGTCSFTVTVNDAENPTVVSCPADFTVSTDAGTCGADVTFTAPTADDNCPGATVQQTSGPTSGSTFPLGDTIVTFEAVDGNGNISPLCSFTVTVEDNENPPAFMCPTDITTTTDASDCTAVVTFSDPTATDNCPGVTVAQSAGPASGSNFPVGTTVVSYTATDAAGNSSPACSFNVIVTDDEVPTISSCPANIATSTDAGSCSAFVSFPTPTANDNCPGVTISRTEGPASGSDFPEGVTTVTFVATDAAGAMSAPCTFTVTVTDNEEPTINGCPSDISVSTDSDVCTAVVTYTAPTAADNCAGATVALTGGLASGSAFPEGVTTVTYDATDAEGNVSVTPCSFTVTVTDDQVPTIDDCPSDIMVSNDAGECEAVVNYSEPTITDNCPGGSVSRTSGPASGDAFPVGSTTVTYDATDADGNVSATCSFVVTVVDDEAPTLDSCPTDMTVGTDLNSCDAVVTFTEPTPLDNCPGPSVALLAGFAPGSTFPIGDTVVTYQATDAAGIMSADCTFTVTVEDTQDPVLLGCPADISVSNDAGNCDAVVSYTAPTADDNCPGSTVGRTGPASGSAFPVGTTTVTHVATDGAGRMSAPCTFTVTVTDTERPTVAACPSDISVSAAAGACDQTVTYATPTPADNCPGSTIALTGGLASGASFPVGVTTVTYETADVAGNTSDECLFTVTVTDDELPTITCPSDISMSTAAGECGRIVTYSTPSASDNCPGASVARTAGPASGSTFPVGVTTVTYIATDAATNMSPSCSFTVTIVDDEVPAISCPGNIVTNNDSGDCGSSVTYSLPTFTDNCPGGSVALVSGLTSGSTFPVGVSTVTFEATDAAGNTSPMCSFTVTVNDVEAPTLSSCPSDIAVGSDAADCSAVVSYAAPTPSDNCPGSMATLTAGLPSGASFPAGVTTVSYIATDADGNLSAPCSFTVTVTDTESPTLSACPPNLTRDTAANTCSSFTTYTTPVGADNCPGVTVNRLSGFASGDLFPLGVTTVQFEAEDTTGNTSPSCQFTVTVSDNVDPSVSCPADVAVATSSGRGSAVVTYPTPSVDDNCPGAAPTLVSGPASGDDLPIGIYTVVYSATDASGNTASSCSFTITVTLGTNELPDTCVPVSDTETVFPNAATFTRTVSFSSAFSIKRIEVDMDASGIQEFTNLSLSHNGITVSLRMVSDCSMASYAGTVTFSDGAPNCAASGLTEPNQPLSAFNGMSVQGAWTFTANPLANAVTINRLVIRAVGNGIPQINCYSVSATNDPGLCSASVFYREPDTCSITDTAVITRNGLESGSVFPVGSTQVNYLLTAGSQTDSCVTTITVVDAELPVVTGCPSNIIATADVGGSCGTAVSWSEASISRTDNCALASTSQTHMPGDFFAVGVSNVVYSAVDSSGNENSCSFTVTVNDATAPVYTNCPGDITQESACNDAGTVVTWTPPSLSSDCLSYEASNVQPGDKFSDGAFTVAYAALQGQAYATCVFDVIVEPCAGEGGSNRPPGAFGTIDLDGDGYFSDAPLSEWRDCCDSPEDHCSDPFLVNPGAFEIPHNGQEDSCRGVGPTADIDFHTPGCDTDQILAEDFTIIGPTQSPLETEKVAYAMELCEFKDDDDDPSWGFRRQKSLTFTLANGTRNGYDIGIDGPHVSQAAVLRNFGQITPSKGEFMVAISSGTARDQLASGSADPSPGFSTGNTAVNLPPTFLDGGVSDFIEDCASSPYGIGLDSISMNLDLHQPSNMRGFSLRALYLDNELDAAQGSYPAQGTCDAFRQSWFLAIKTNSQTGVSASGNFAGDNSGRSFNSFNANPHFWEQCRSFDAATGACAGGHRALADTGYSGASGWTTIGTSAEPGERFTLDLVTFDGVDSSHDVTVLIDDFFLVGEARTKGSDSFASRPWGYQYRSDLEMVYLAPLDGAFVVPRATASSVTLEFTLRNYGPEEANDIYLSFTPPVGTKFSSAKDANGSSMTCSATSTAAPYADNGLHRCQFRQNPTLAAGSSASGSVSFDVDLDCEACGSSISEFHFRLTASQSSVDQELGNNYLTSSITLI